MYGFRMDELRRSDEPVMNSYKENVLFYAGYNMNSVQINKVFITL